MVLSSSYSSSIARSNIHPLPQQITDPQSNPSISSTITSCWDVVSVALHELDRSLTKSCADFARARAEMQAGFAQFRAEMRVDFAKIRADCDKLRADLEDIAATRIQRIFRGYLVRRHRLVIDENAQQAETKFQIIFREFLSKRVIHRLKDATHPQIDNSNLYLLQLTTSDATNNRVLKMDPPRFTYDDQNRTDGFLLGDKGRAQELESVRDVNDAVIVVSLALFSFPQVCLSTMPLTFRLDAMMEDAGDPPWNPGIAVHPYAIALINYNIILRAIGPLTWHFTWTKLLVVYAWNVDRIFARNLFDELPVHLMVIGNPYSLIQQMICLDSHGRCFEATLSTTKDVNKEVFSRALQHKEGHPNLSLKPQEQVDRVGIVIPTIVIRIGNASVIDLDYELHVDFVFHANTHVAAVINLTHGGVCAYGAKINFASLLSFMFGFCDNASYGDSVIANTKLGDGDNFDTSYRALNYGLLFEGMEEEAALLGQHLRMLFSGIFGFKLPDKCCSRVPTIDLVSTMTQVIRKHGVLGKFVEFYGNGKRKFYNIHRDCLQNFQGCQSLGLQLGSTLGVLLHLLPRGEYLDQILLTLVVFPSHMASDIVWEPHNATFSVHQLDEKVDECIVLDTKTLYNFCFCTMKIITPSFGHLNQFVSATMHVLTSCLCFPILLYFDLGKVVVPSLGANGGTDIRPIAKAVVITNSLGLECFEATGTKMQISLQNALEMTRYKITYGPMATLHLTQHAIVWLLLTFLDTFNLENLLFMVHDKLHYKTCVSHFSLMDFHDFTFERLGGAKFPSMCCTLCHCIVAQCFIFDPGGQATQPRGRGWSEGGWNVTGMNVSQ